MKPIIFLLLDIERAIQSIAQSPHTWPVLEGELRRRLIRRFPCGILYKIDPEAVVIIAVAHLRKQPGYWRKRIKQG